MGENSVHRQRVDQPRRIYILFGGLDKASPGRESQVRTWLERLDREVLVFDVLIFEGLRSALINRQEIRDRLARWRASLKGRVFLSYVTQAQNGVGIYMAVCRLLLLVLKDILRKREIVIHSRGQTSALVASWLKKLYGKTRPVLDMRGEEGAEFLFLAKQRGLDLEDRRVRRRYQVLKAREKQVIEMADHILCVSKAFKRHLQNQYPIPDGKIDVIPCSADPALFFYDKNRRQQTRKELGLEDKLVVVYSGSIRAWQLPDKVVKVFTSLRQTAENLHLLILTPVPELAEKHLKGRIAKDHYTVLSVDHTHVAKYLMAADLGLLLREKHLLNQVASPTKFAEYLMCGLPVMLTSGIGDTAEVIAKHKAGILIEDLENEQEIIHKFIRFRGKQIGEEERQRLSTIGTYLFSRERYLTLILKVYEDLDRTIYC